VRQAAGISVKQDHIGPSFAKPWPSASSVAPRTGKHQNPGKVKAIWFGTDPVGSSILWDVEVEL